MDLRNKANELILNAAQRRISEDVKITQERIDKAFDRRKQALKKIEDYQAISGIPQKDEIDEHFLKEEAKLNVSLDEFRNSPNMEDL